MDITIINGSYHKDGMTQQLIDAFCEGIGKADVRQYSLRDMDFSYCDACCTCMDTQGGMDRCPKKDLLDVHQRMLDSDIIIYASPIHLFGPTAVMKKFMERNLPAMDFSSGMPRPRLGKDAQKTGVILLSSGAPYPFNILLGITRHPTKMLRMLLKGFGCGRISTLRAGGMQIRDRTREKELQRARKLGGRIRKNSTSRYSGRKGGPTQR